MKNLIWIILMSASFTAFSQRYVLFNPNCMERLKYDVLNGYGGESYIVYSVELNTGEKLFLEVGKESDKFETRISRAVITCNSTSINRNMVNQINNASEEKYFIVLKEDQGRFRVSPVIAASYFKNSDKGIEYNAGDYSFTYNNWNNTPSQNLANPAQGGRVFFVGNSRYECMDAYTFSVNTAANSEIGNDLTIIPEIGVIEFRTNTRDGSGTRRLSTINATTFRAFVQDKCKNVNYDPTLTDRGEDTTPTGNTGSPVVTTRPNTTTDTYYEGYDANKDKLPAISSTTASSDYGMIARHDGVAPTTVYENTQVGRVQPTVTTPPNTVSNQPGIHIVSKGDNLYRLSQKYAITLDQIKSWNNLTSNVIYPGTRLYVAPSEVLVSRGNANVATNTNTVGNTTIAATETEWPANVNRAWEITNGYHTLKRGETIGGVARMYGYTEDRFRDLNDLSTGVQLPVGYRLKTLDCEPSATTRPKDNYVSDDNTMYRDEFLEKNDGGFNDDFEFRTSVTTPAPYGDSNYRRIDSDSDNISNTTYRGNVDYRKAASPTSYSQDGSLDIRFDRKAQLHLVKENETLYSIARKYNTSVTRLAAANSLDVREVLLPGQSIFIR